MKYTIGTEFPAWLLEEHDKPCISLYQPTHRHIPLNQQDPIRFKNLVKSTEESLLQKYPKKDVAPLIDSFNAIADDRSFWNHTLDGLAIFRSPDIFLVYHLQRPVPEIAVASDSFHVKPMMRIFQSADRYQVLCLNRKEIRLLEGNRDTLDEIDLSPDVPKTIKEALGDEYSDPHLTVSSYGGIGKGMYHGQGSKKDEVKGDTERFFRAVDRAIWDHHSRPSGLPLLLAALPEYHNQFREVSRNTSLLGDGIKTNPDSHDLDALRKMSWDVVEPIYLKRLNGFVETYQSAKSRGLATDRIEDIALAVVQGQVETLLVEADKEIPGKFDKESGRVELNVLSDPDTDDLLDDLAEMVIKTKGEVVIVPEERMPTESGMAAVLRF
jgi:hypothetical protein